jgi:hypothetical protein
MLSPWIRRERYKLAVTRRCRGAAGDGITVERLPSRRCSIWLRVLLGKILPEQGAILLRLASKAFRKPDSSGRTPGWIRASAFSSMKNDASIALSYPQNRTACR